MTSAAAAPTTTPSSSPTTRRAASSPPCRWTSSSRPRARAKKVASITCEPSAVYAARRNVGFEAKIKELGYEVVATLSGQLASRKRATRS